jgi:hypothetical protein
VRLHLEEIECELHSAELLNAGPNEDRVMKKLLLLALLLPVGVAQAQQPGKPTPTVAAEILSWEMQNAACHGGDQQACRYRDAVLLAIQSQGWCLSDAQKWQPAPCKSEPAAVPLSDRILQIKDRLPASLQKDWADFAARLSVVEPVIETEDGWLLGRGCMAHRCNTDATAWAVSKTTHVFGAIIEKDGKLFIYYGPRDIPTPLAAWGVANGMTDSNTKQSGLNSGFQTYTNNRYGFRVDYPLTFIPQTPPDNGDGLNFRSQDGKATLEVSGANNDGFTLKGEFDSAIKNVHGQLGYNKTGGSWFVVTWTDGDNIGYTKKFVGPGSQNSFTFTFPVEQKSQYGSVVTAIEKSFQPGDLDDSH